MAEKREPLLQQGPAHTAAQRGDVAALSALDDAELQKEFCGAKALHLAAAANQLRALDFLLSRKKDSINEKDDQGRVPLIHAVVGRAAEAIVWLVKNGADLTAADALGFTPLHWAAELGSSSLVALLRTLGAPLDARTASGDTPLGLAVRGSRLEVVEYLVLVVGITADEQAEALSSIKPGPCRFWLRRCLQSKVGCHDVLEGGGPCDPRLGGGFLPLEARCWRGPEQIHVEPRQACILCGILALVGAWILLRGDCGEGDSAGRTAAVFSVATTCVGSLCFVAASSQSPGSVAPSPELRTRYRQAVDHAAAVRAADADNSEFSWWGTRAPLHHELEMVGPERSKYCTATRQCVPIFDHYCAFLRNSVGPGNYAAFFAAMLCAAATCLSLAWAFWRLPTRHVWLCEGAAAFFGVVALPLLAMLGFQCALASYGLTTWEMLQLVKGRPVPYLLDANGQFQNPYHRGFFLNLTSRLLGTCDTSDTCGTEKTGEVAV
ncbi:PAT23 [Symbiodinium natans]|uniref:Palmitoyltransferase n=1 Tax=Symbiodinium natans TaxID=878477 RepID=A0A812SAI2_9DINO|nr:PAT23 [Symbiodinium natans]